MFDPKRSSRIISHSKPFYISTVASTTTGVVFFLEDTTLLPLEQATTPFTSHVMVDHRIIDNCLAPIQQTRFTCKVGVLEVSNIHHQQQEYDIVARVSSSYISLYV